MAKNRLIYRLYNGIGRTELATATSLVKANRKAIKLMKANPEYQVTMTIEHLMDARKLHWHKAQELYGEYHAPEPNGLLGT